MATPQRMVELECPKCQHARWEIDCDSRGAELAYAFGESTTPRELSYDERAYRCPTCNEEVVGYRVLQKSPPEFFLQPHPMLPMTSRDFSYWLSVFRANFPTDDLLKTVGVFWYPGDSSEEQLRNLFEALDLGVAQGYRLCVCNRSPDDEVVRVRVVKWLSMAEFRYGSTIDADLCYEFHEGELDEIRELLAAKASEIDQAWQRFVKVARKAQAEWVPKLVWPAGG